MAETATIAKAQILITVRDEARKILQQLGPVGVKSLTDIQKQVEALDAAMKEQGKTIKTLQAALEKEAEAAKKAGTETTVAGNAAKSAAQGATIATNAWSFAVKTLDRVWKGLKSALIIAPLLALAQSLLSAIVDVAKSVLGFGDDAEKAAGQVDMLTEAQKRLNDALVASVEAQERARAARSFGAGPTGGNGSLAAAAESDALRQRVKMIEALQRQIIQGELTDQQTMNALIVNVQRNRYVAADKAFGSTLARDTYNAAANGNVGGVSAQGAVALLDDELARVNARLGQFAALMEPLARRAPGGPSAGVLAEADFAGNLSASAFAGEFGKNVGLPAGLQSISSQGGPAALAGLNTATLQPVQADTTTSYAMLTAALGDQRKAMADLNYEATLLSTTLAAQAKEERRATIAGDQKLSLMAKVATTDAERIEVINLQINAEERLLAEQLEAGKLVRAEYDEQLALLERLRKQKVDGVTDIGTDLTNPQAGIGVSALATAFSDITTNAQSATGAATQFFASILKGLADVAAKQAAEGIFGLLFSSAASGAGGGSNVVPANESFTNYKAAKGAIFPGHFQAFANGGIATQPTLGLIAEAGRNEAVVPLPDNRSIPVIFPDGGGGGTTIVVNATVQAIDGSDFEARLDRSSKRIAAIVAAKMATHRDLRHSTRETVRGGR